MAKKILVVEDDAVLRGILANKLEGAGFAISAAEDGLQAMEMLKNDPPDLLLLDILLPKKGGLEILQEMRRDNRLKNILVIAISNSGDPTEIEKSKALGVKDFLIKAVFDSGDILERVKRVLADAGGEISVPKSFVVEKKVVPQPQASEKKSVLIVEDDKFLRELAAEKLRHEGFKVFEVNGGKEVFEILPKEKIDLIILDLILPGMDGFEVLQKIKTGGIYSSIPVVVLSNLGQQEDVEKAKSLGARDYLIKAHFSFGEIVDKIKEALAGV